MHLLSDLLASYEADGLDLAPSTQAARAYFCRQLLTTFGNVPLSMFTPDVIRQWRVDLALRHKPATVGKYLSRLRAILRYARACGWLDSDPFAAIRVPGAGEPRVRYLLPDERVRLLAACRQSRNPLLYAVVVVALGTGGRKDEVRCLQWPAVDLDMRVVRFVKTKTHRARAVPLVGECFDVVVQLWQERRGGVPWVFPSWRGDKPVAITSPWETARDAAGIKDFRFHDLRHSFASYLAMNGASLRDIAELLGHSSVQMTLIYTHLMPAHTRGVVERMHDQWLREG
jgi:integrase